MLSFVNRPHSTQTTQTRSIHHLSADVTILLFFGGFILDFNAMPPWWEWFSCACTRPVHPHPHPPLPAPTHWGTRPRLLVPALRACKSAALRCGGGGSSLRLWWGQVLSSPPLWAGGHLRTAQPPCSPPPPLTLRAHRTHRTHPHLPCADADFLRYAWGALMVNQFDEVDPVWQNNRTVLQNYGLKVRARDIPETRTPLS